MATVKVGNTLVKIYHWQGKNGYHQFKVAYHADGKRLRETFGSLAKAKARANEIAVMIERGERDVLKLSNADRTTYLHAVRLLEPLSIPLNVAVEEYVAAREHLVGGESLLTAVKEHTRRHRHVIEKRVGEVVEEFLSAKKNEGMSARYLMSLRCDLRRFAAAVQINIGAVTSGLIVEWLKSLNVGPRASNNIRGSVVTLFHFARSLGYLPKGQSTEADDVPKVKNRGGKIGILKPQQLALLLEKADAEAALYLALGAFSGIRTAELIRLEWEDINFERHHIIVGKDKAKTATRRLVPIPPNLMQWLAPYKGQTGRLFAGLHVPDRIIGFAKEHVPWPSNALRHSFATYRLAMTNDAGKVALEMGNSPQMLFRDYRELADKRDAKSWFAVAPKRSTKIVDFAAAQAPGRKAGPAKLFKI